MGRDGDGDGWEKSISVYKKQDGIELNNSAVPSGIHVVAKPIGPICNLNCEYTYDEPGLHYLCPGYKRFFRHIRKYMKVMAALLENGLPASYVMEAMKGPLVVRTGRGCIPHT